MASRSGSRKKSGSTSSGEAGDKDLLIGELKDRIAVLEKELRLKQECATLSGIAERKRADEELKLTMFDLDYFPESAIWVTMDGSIAYVNREACKSLEYSREELLSMHIWDIDHDRPPEKFRELWPEKKQGRYTKFESKHVARDGRVFPVEVTSCYMRYGDKEYLITFDRDITDRKRAEDTLKLASFSLDHAQDIILWLHPDGRFYYANEAACERLGYGHNELLSLSIFDISPYYTRETWDAQWRRLRKEGSLYYETENRAKDGSLLPIEVTLNYIKYGDQELACGYARDITKRKRAEEALRKSEEKYRRIVETANEGIWIIDRDTRTTFVNDKMSRMLGYTVEEMSGKKIQDFVSDPDMPVLHSSLGRHLSGVMVQLDFRLRRKDGSHMWCIVSANPKLDENGDFAGGVAMITDITERKRAEEELKASKEQAELYLDLMGHDINNMNQSAIGFLELALETLETDGKIGLDGKLFIEKPMKAINNSSQLIENVGKLQRLMTEGIKTRPIDLHKVFEELKAHDFHTSGKDVTIQYGRAPRCMVEGNELLRDVFFNLINNAIKHSSPDRPVTVDVRAKRVDEADRAFYRCIVEDDGPGIPDEMKPKLFHRFQRGKTKAHGKGLGLYIVRTLVEGYHGKVWVEDRVKGDHTKGARFVVMLPAVEN